MREACVGRAATQVEWGGAPGALASALLHFTAKAAAAAEAQQLKKQAVWVPKCTYFLNISGTSQMLNARKLIILII